MGVLLRGDTCQIRVEISIESLLRELGFCEIGKTLSVKGVLEMLEAQNEI